MRTSMKRIPIALPHFTPEILELFLALEKVKPAQKICRSAQQAVGRTAQLDGRNIGP